MHESKSHDLHLQQHSPCQARRALFSGVRDRHEAPSHSREPHYLTLFVTSTALFGSTD
ncbi:hypothetical protein [Pseudomonas sp. PLMAX]|uniref:hypothetical protein n=1 Tax=Pseudomonas sp. PLMAX TaxID=2201998 RepID=UPI0038BB9497